MTFQMLRAVKGSPELVFHRHYGQPVEMLRIWGWRPVSLKGEVCIGGGWM